MGDEPTKYFNYIVKLNPVAYRRARIGQKYSVEVAGELLKGEIINKLADNQVTVRLVKPRNWAI